MEIKVENTPINELPVYQTIETAGANLRANLPEGVIRLIPSACMLVSMGLYLGIPDGCETRVCPHGGLSIRHGITTVSAPGTIDHDCRDEVKVPIANFSNKAFEIVYGDRIAQMIFIRYGRASFREVSVSSETERDAGGFGSTDD